MTQRPKTLFEEETPHRPLIEAVFIDPLMACMVNRNWRWPKSCHMFMLPGGDLERLHAFAKKIGLRRGWFQDKAVPHYDLNEQRRKAAVAAGAIELDRHNAVPIFRRWREITNSGRAR